MSSPDEAAMKRDRDSDALAARLTAAGNQPPVVLAFTPPLPEQTETEKAEKVASEPTETVTTPVEEPKPKKGNNLLDAQACDTLSPTGQSGIVLGRRLEALVLLGGDQRQTPFPVG
jgi:hypothetical protein